MAQFYTGTSGWSYQHWKDCFYNGVARKNWLKFYAEHFSSVEINGTFYRLQKADTFRKWFDETPDSFRFTMKANRYLTHHQKLREPHASVLIEKNHASILKDKLAVVLWQFPKTLIKNPKRLQQFLKALQQWPEVHHAIEFRNSSWFDDETADYLEEAAIAVCISDAGSWPLWDRVTSDLVYIRLHGSPETYVSPYNTQALNYWAGRIARWLKQNKQVYIYFDNDAECAAPRNAGQLQMMLNERVMF